MKIEEWEEYVWVLRLPIIFLCDFETVFDEWMNISYYSCILSFFSHSAFKDIFLYCSDMLKCEIF